MTTVKFDKAVKYQGVRYAAHEAFKVSDNDVELLKKAGATVLSVEPVDPPEPEPGVQDNEDADNSEGAGSDESVSQLKEKLLDYATPDLIQFAQDRGIDIQGKTRKADIYNIIVAALN